MPIISAATTYAVGQIFIQHFESGGTLLSFDAEKAMGLFKGLFKKGRVEAEEMAKEGRIGEEDKKGPDTWGETEDIAPVDDEPAEDAVDDVPQKKKSRKKKPAKKTAAAQDA